MHCNAHKKAGESDGNPALSSYLPAEALPLYKAFTESSAAHLIRDSDIDKILERFKDSPSIDDALDKIFSSVSKTASEIQAEALKSADAMLLSELGSNEVEWINQVFTGKFH